MTDTHYVGYAFRRLQRNRRIKLPLNFIRTLHATSASLTIALRPDIDRRCILAHSSSYSGISNAWTGYDPGADRCHFGLSTTMEIGIDDQIILPEPLAEFCDISESALLFAAGSLFEIWDPISFLQQPWLSQYELDLALSLMGEPGSRTGEAKFGQCEWKSIHQNLAAIGQDFSSQSALEAYTILGGRA